MAIKETNRDVPSLVRLIESLAKLLDDVVRLPLLYQSELTASRHHVRRKHPSRSAESYPGTRLYFVLACLWRQNKRLTVHLLSAPIEPLKVKSIYVVPGSTQPTRPHKYEHTPSTQSAFSPSQRPQADPQQRSATTLLLASVSIPSMTISPCRWGFGSGLSEPVGEK